MLLSLFRLIGSLIEAFKTPRKSPSMALIFDSTAVVGL